MKAVRFLLIAALAVSQIAHADDLQDAQKAFGNKSYSEALRLYSKAAASGNAEAQFRLGEMYWYGEGVAADEAAASEWFRKASAAGNTNASAALATIHQRHVRRADIDYWFTKYDGADLKTGQYDCHAPVIPAVSDTNKEIARVNAEFAAWRDCYNGFVTNLNASLPAGKRIPSDIEVLMSEQELDKARRHMDSVYQRVSAEQAAAAKVTMDQYAAWGTQTQAVVAKANEEALRRKKVEEAMLARSQEYQRIDGANPMGPKGATVGAGR